MSREIDGKIYKDVPVGKVNVNGKEIEGNVIGAEHVNEGIMEVTIVSKDEEEK